MQWPLQFLESVIGLAVVAIVIPWIIPPTRRGVLGVFAALAATAAWMSYENHLAAIARTGDPLIRVDLMLILPLIFLDWVSGLAAIAQARRSRPVA